MTHAPEKWRAAGDVAEVDILLRVLLDPQGLQFRVRGDIRTRLRCGLKGSNAETVSFSAAAAIIITALGYFHHSGCLPWGMNDYDTS
jgi:hypothetical protein